MSTVLDVIFRIATGAILIYAALVVAKRERTLRQPVKYHVTYFRAYTGGYSYGSVGLDVRGGINGENLGEVAAKVKEITGFQDAFIMGFSRFED